MRGFGFDSGERLIAAQSKVFLMPDKTASTTRKLVRCFRVVAIFLPYGGLFCFYRSFGELLFEIVDIGAALDKARIHHQLTM